MSLKCLKFLPLAWAVSLSLAAVPALAAPTKAKPAAKAATKAGKTESAKPAHEAKAPATPVELTWAHNLDDTRAERLQQLVDRFNGSQKDYKLVLERRTGDAPPALLNLATRAELADFFALRAGFKPLSAVLGDAKEKADLSKLAPELKAPVSEGKTVLALPMGFSTPVLFWNKDVFRKAGLDPDAPPHTWHEVQTTAGKLFAAGVECPYTTSWPAWVHLDNVSARNGAGTASGPTQLSFNGLVQVKHVAMLATWYKAKYFTYYGRTNEADNHFAQGECGMLTSGSDVYAEMSNRDNIGVAPLPFYDDVYGAPQRTLASGASLWVGAGRTPAEYKGAAKFVSFLLQPDIQIEIARIGGFLPLTPAAQAAAHSKLLKADMVNQEVAFRQLQAKAEKDAKPGYVALLDPVRVIVDEELEAVWNDVKPAKEALDTAVRRGNSLLGGKSRLIGF